MSAQGYGLSGRIWSILSVVMLCVSLSTAAIADGPAGLGKLQPPSQGTAWVDGSVHYENGVILYANGTVEWGDPENTFWYPQVLSDGSFLYVDGTRLYPDGSITYL